MQLRHAQTLAQARSYLAALADSAGSIEASSAYERVLFELDRVHDDECPALDTDALTTDHDLLFAVAGRAIEGCGDFGVDALCVELLLAMLDAARELDVR